MKVKKKKASAFYCILFPLLILVLLQVVILYSILYINGVFKSLNNNSLKLLAERTQNKQQELMGRMINDWSNLLNTESAIDALVQNELQQSGKTWEDIRTDEKLNQDLVEKAAGELIQTLRNNKTTGIYMVLDGIAVKDEEDSYAGIYIRKSDPNTNADDMSDLLMLRGFPSLSRNLGLSLASFWKADFTFDGGESNPDNRFFFNPLRQAQAYESDNSQYFGYWSPPFAFGNSGDYETVMYSLPLINADGFAYGVLGVEISQSYLTSLINNELYGNRENCFYFLGITEDSKQTFQKVAVTGSRYYMDQIQTDAEEQIDNQLFIKTLNKQDEVVYGSVFDLGLYGSNTPFLGEQWVLVGMEDRQTLFQSADQTRSLILISMVISLLIGCVISFLATRKVVHPITSLAAGVCENSHQELVKLPHAGILEIDELADSIENMYGELLASAKRTSQLIELSGLPVGVYEIKAGADYAYCSDGFYSLMSCACRKDQKNRMSLTELQTVLACVTKKPVGDSVYEVEGKKGRNYLRVTMQTDDKGSIGAVLDVTKEIEDKIRIEKERDYDSLTGIWNRRAFENRMEYLFGEEKQGLGVAAVVMLDMDNLKSLNDSYGHDCGDEYIRTFAEALRECRTERMLFARRSGDEFYLFLYGYRTKEALYRQIMKCWDHVCNKVLKLPDSSSCRLRASGGISWYPQDANTPARMIHYADFAMYQVKRSQKGSIMEFDKERYSADAVLFNGHNALNRLIDEELIHFMFQPIYSAHTGETFGYELLMRSDVEELKTPDVILKMAKSQGKLHHIERITWFRALEDAKSMIAEGKLEDHTYLFINSIANQTLFKEESEQIIREFSDVLPRMVLEVTESEDNNMEYTRRKLKLIQAFGGLVAIDDFGTGYNSELALVRISANIVKIDISLVRDVDSDQDKQALIKNLISYAKRRGIGVLAEGIETSQELKTLIGFGVDYLQGFYLARPSYEPKPLNELVKREIIEAEGKKNAQ